MKEGRNEPSLQEGILQLSKSELAKEIDFPGITTQNLNIKFN